MFNRVLCGVDESPESRVAVRQAARVTGPRAHLVLAAVADLGPVIQAGWSATAVSDEIVGEAQAALAAAQAEAPRAEAVLLEGSPGDLLLRTALEQQADLLVVGTHGGSRAGGIVFGSVATLMLHKAPCSVLVARASGEPERFPKSICIGVDGSAGSAVAARVGYELATAFGSSVSAVAACGGTKLELDPVRAIAADAAIDERPPVEALVGQAAETRADLLVVGSRGLHGLAALGSVSERVAHRASCSVLVVREEAATSEVEIPR